ncbi:E3 ubiquitin/ISG15 ligase TRIM25 [Centroberyx gerrardi]
MASAQSEQSSVLQEELTCPVCLDVYRDPHLLPCGHNFCMSCLRRLKRQAERGRFRCPECRDSHRCGSNFQKNFKLANIAEDYRRRGRAASTSREPLSSSLAPQPFRTPFSVPCDYCPPVGAEASGSGPAGEGPSVASVSREKGETQAAVAAAAASMMAVKTCLKCEVSMCQEHVKPHLELPAFREHPLTDPLDDFRKRKCPDHDEIYRYYCMDDKVCVCNACTIEGGHSGHTIKTLKNTMKDLKGALDKQLYRVERKYSMAEKKLHEQKEKERQNRKFMEDSDQCMTRLGEEMKVKVDGFICRLRDWTRIHCDTNGPAIQKNISRICQDQARLQEVRCGIEGLLMQENDPFRFIEAYKTTGKQCRRQLRKTMFYPEYIDMETDVLGATMEEEMIKFLKVELHSPVIAAIDSLCHFPEPEEEEEEQEENEEEAAEEEEEDEDDLDDSSEEEEEMRSEGEEEEEEEEGHDQSESADDVYSPEGEEEEGEEEDEDEEEEEDEDEEGDDDEERGV